MTSFLIMQGNMGSRGGGEGGDNLKLQTDQWSFLRVKVINRSDYG